MATGDQKYSFVITTIEESPFCVLIQNRVWQLRILMLFPADFFITCCVILILIFNLQYIIKG